jgi:hypothetical protein
MAVARVVAATNFVPDSYRGNPDAVVAAIFTGRELGIGPMQSLRDIHMIDGRPVFSASLMLAQMRRGGVQVLESESTRERAWIRAQRKDTGEIAEVEWTFAEAVEIKRKGKSLADGDNWKNYPADMLWARAVGRLARRLGSDLLAGMVYSSEELKDLEGFDTDGYNATAAAKQEPVTWESIDPGKQLHPNAPKGWGEVKLVMDAIDGSRDWPWIVQAILSGRYRVTRVADLGEHYQEAGRRLANCVAYIADVLMEGREFPPPSSEEVQQAVAWAFEGLIIDPIDPPEGEVVEGEVVDEGGDAALSAEEAEEMRLAFDASGEEIPFGEEGGSA